MDFIEILQIIGQNIEKLYYKTTAYYTCKNAGLDV